MMAARACTLSDPSPPPRISAESAPIHPCASRMGATIAPFAPPGRDRTIWTSPERYAAAAALFAVRGTVGSRSLRYHANRHKHPIEMMLSKTYGASGTETT